MSEPITKSDEVKAILATLPEESRSTITEYFDELALAADDIYTLVDVSRLAFESLSLSDGDSIGKTLFTAVNDAFGLHAHFAAMAAEGACDE